MKGLRFGVLISILVPAFNEERLLGGSLEAIKTAAQAFTERGWPWELILCDNNSTDRTAEIARDAGAQVVFEPFNQIGKARNTAARAAKGDWLFFVDADSYPDKGLLRDAAEAIATDYYIAGGAAIRLNTDHRVANLVNRLWNWISRRLSMLAGSFIFCEAAAFREIGGFDEALFASEEIDLSKRLKSLARKRRKKLVILTKHPMLTSERKIHLYSVREYLWVIGKALFTGKQSLKSREHCHPWYDGRR